jgi:hypothetical protein
MHKYLIERSIPGAGYLNGAQLADISRTSVNVLADMSGRAQWIESYVTDDKIFCVYLANDPEALREHGAAGGFPVDAIYRIGTVIDPTTAEQALAAVSQ